MQFRDIHFQISPILNFLMIVLILRIQNHRILFTLELFYRIIMKFWKRCDNFGNLITIKYPMIKLQKAHHFPSLIQIFDSKDTKFRSVLQISWHRLEIFLHFVHDIKMRNEKVRLSNSKNIVKKNCLFMYMYNSWFYNKIYQFILLKGQSASAIGHHQNFRLWGISIDETKVGVLTCPY